MLIKVKGQNKGILIGYLASQGYSIIETGPVFDYLISLEHTNEGLVELDGIESVLEAKIASNIAKLVPEGRIILQRGGGYQSGNRIRIYIPEKVVNQTILGIFRGILEAVPLRPSRLRFLARAIGL